MSMQSAAQYLETCGGLALIVDINSDGQVTRAVTDPASEAIPTEVVQSAFRDSKTTPEPGRYTFAMFDGQGTRLETAPSLDACDAAQGLEIAIDAKVAQKLLPRIKAAATSSLPSDAGGGLHGAGMHGGIALA